MKPLLRLALGLGFLFLVSCTVDSQKDSKLVQLNRDVQRVLTCPNMRSEVFSSYYNAYGNLDGEEMGSEISSLVTQDLQKPVQKIHQIMTKEIKKLQIAGLRNEHGNEGRDPVLHLIRLEMRSHIDPQYDELNQKLDEALGAASYEAKAQGLPCQAPEDEPADSASPTAAALEGAYWTMATAYQSCGVIQLPPITLAVPDLKGVVKDDMIDDVGWGRRYTDIAALKQTDYYLQNQTYQPPCTDLSHPLVYDYGGVPVIKSSTLISLFENSGGGPAIGIDCLAFI